MAACLASLCHDWPPWSWASWCPDTRSAAAGIQNQNILGHPERTFYSSDHINSLPELQKLGRNSISSSIREVRSKVCVAFIALSFNLEPVIVCCLKVFRDLSHFRHIHAHNTWGAIWVSVCQLLGRWTVKHPSQEQVLVQLNSRKTLIPGGKIQPRKRLSYEAILTVL